MKSNLRGKTKVQRAWVWRTAWVEEDVCVNTWSSLRTASSPEWDELAAHCEGRECGEDWLICAWAASEWKLMRSLPEKSVALRVPERCVWSGSGMFALPTSETSLFNRGFWAVSSCCCDEFRLFRTAAGALSLTKELLCAVCGLVTVEFLFGEEVAALDGIRGEGSKALGSRGGCTRCISVEAVGGSVEETAAGAGNAGSEPREVLAPIWFNNEELEEAAGWLGRSGGWEWWGCSWGGGAWGSGG